MILRIRLPSGVTQRITLSDADGLADLGAKIEALDVTDGQFSLYSDPKFTQPFQFDRARHGDFVFIKGVSKPTPADVASASKPTDASATKQPPTAAAKPGGADANRACCKTGMRGMCENCMPKEDKRARYQAELAKWKGRGMSIAVMEALEALKFKIAPQEKPYAAAAAVANDAAENFQAYIAKTGFSQQRLGICYGQVNDETNETEILAIYEPPQRGSADQYQLIQGEEAGDMTQRADAIAPMLGLKRVGLVFSARPRKCILSALDVVTAARMASALSEEDRRSFVVLVVSATETGETAFEAYQISDLAIEMYEAGIFEDEDKQKANGGRVSCKETVLVEGKDTKKVHTEFFLLNIPIKSCDSWLRTSFAVENRELAPQGPADLRKVVSDESIPYHKRLADFHVLLFLSNMFDMNTDMPGLAAAVKSQSEDIGEGYRLMIEGMTSS